jgi:DMSO/TMAO reductase YedYZ molybdopterin-dependent catalytic subunit
MADEPHRPEQSPEEELPDIALEDSLPRDRPGDDAAPEFSTAAPVMPLVGPAGEKVRDLTAGERKRLDRRELLKLAPVLAIGAFAIPKLRGPLLMGGLHLSDWASAKLFGRHRLEPTYSDSAVAPFARFPYNYYDVVDPGVDLANWKLTVEGMVERPGEYTLQQIQALPKLVQNTRHVCVEGWDVVGNFGGAPGSDFLRAIGADLNARFVEVECADEYCESIDMATMLHPQTLFCYEMYGQPLDRGHGAPLRLQMPTKLGYKQAKYLETVRVTNVLKNGMRGYWEDQGYDWYGGL